MNFKSCKLAFDAGNADFSRQSKLLQRYKCVQDYSSVRAIHPTTENGKMFNCSRTNTIFTPNEINIGKHMLLALVSACKTETYKITNIRTPLHIA